MTAGFPTDDPWGDRQQGLPLDDFDQISGRRAVGQLGARHPVRVLQPQLRRARPGHHGGDRERVRRLRVREMLLAPLGIDRTGYEPGEFSPDELARGYQRDDGGWRRAAAGPATAHSPRWAALFSSVADLARWVAGWRTPSRRERADGGPHPLRRRPGGSCSSPQLIIPFGGGQPGSAARRRTRSATGSACSSRTTRCTAASCSTAAVIRATAVTCAGIWPPGPGHDRAGERNLRGRARPRRPDARRAAHRVRGAGQGGHRSDRQHGAGPARWPG